MLECNKMGILIKPFDPNLTGQYNYQKRLNIMKQNSPNEKEHVELPRSLGSNRVRNYSPQNNHLEGFAQMPRQFAQPYQNKKLQLKRDLIQRQKSKETARFFESAANTLLSNTMPNPPKEAYKINVDKSIQKRNVNNNTSKTMDTTLNTTSSQQQLISDPWNRSYTTKLADKGPNSVRAMNIGTSYLVAPINKVVNK